MFSQSFTAASFSSCLLWRLTTWTVAQAIRRLTRASQGYPPSSPRKALLLLWPLRPEIAVLLNDEMCSAEIFYAWLMTESEHRILLYASTFILLFQSTVKTSMNASGPVPLAAAHARALTEPLLRLTDELVPCFMLLSSFHDFDRGWFLFHQSIELCSRVRLVSFCVFCELQPGLSVFLGCLHLVVNHLQFWSWSRLLIIDKKTQTPTSWRAFLTCCAVINGFCFTMQMVDMCDK